MTSAGPTSRWARSQPLFVLLAEDNPMDVMIFVRAFKKQTALGPLELQVVGDGEAALQFLNRQGEFAGAKRPDLVVLNINMPKVNGWGVFARMKADPALRRIPVVIWTVAQMEEYDARAYDGGACGIFSKPGSSAEMVEQISAILTYFRWANPGPPLSVEG